MTSDLMYGLAGAAINAVGTMFGTQIDQTTGGLYSKTALGLPNISQFNAIGNAIGVPISKVDELLLLGDAAALGYGVLGKKKEATLGGIGGLLGWFVSKKFLHGEF
jgi:hypothetical protein